MGAGQITARVPGCQSASPTAAAHHVNVDLDTTRLRARATFQKSSRPLHPVNARVARPASRPPPACPAGPRLRHAHRRSATPRACAGGRSAPRPPGSIPTDDDINIACRPGHFVKAGGKGAGVTYASGEKLSFTATFSEPMTVTGVPRPQAVIGSTVRNGAYVGGTGSRRNGAAPLSAHGSRSVELPSSSPSWPALPRRWGFDSSCRRNTATTSSIGTT